MVEATQKYLNTGEIAAWSACSGLILEEFAHQIITLDRACQACRRSSYESPPSSQRGNPEIDTSSDVITSATVGWWFGLQDSKKDSQRVSYLRNLAELKNIKNIYKKIIRPNIINEIQTRLCCNKSWTRASSYCCVLLSVRPVSLQCYPAW